MTGLERIEIIDIIGRELQSRMTFMDVDSYLSSYDIDTSLVEHGNSKYVYVKELFALAKVSNNTVIEIAKELEIKHSSISTNFPKTVDVSNLAFWKTGYFRLFISHLAEHKVKISTLKQALEDYCITGFVAHEDIEPTKEWQEEIEKGLSSMEALIAVLTPKFNNSKWTDQEIGVAMGRDILIIPLRNGLDPYGFIGKYQGFQISGKYPNEIAKGIFEILISNQKTRNAILSILKILFLNSNNTNDALKRIELIRTISNLDKTFVNDIHNKIIDNGILKSQEVLKSSNLLFYDFDLSKIKNSDFDKTSSNVIDDLPF